MLIQQIAVAIVEHKAALFTSTDRREKCFAGIGDLYFVTFFTLQKNLFKPAFLLVNIARKQYVFAALQFDKAAGLDFADIEFGARFGFNLVALAVGPGPCIQGNDADYYGDQNGQQNDGADNPGLAAKPEARMATISESREKRLRVAIMDR